jgi:outer membrane protein OmpA-like peptidoglycan-associated protein
MTRKVILLFPLLFLLVCVVATAQSSSKSKSKDRLREKDDKRYPVTVKNSVGINTPGVDFAPAYYENGIMFVTGRSKNGPRDEDDNPYTEFYFAPFDPNGDPAAPSKFEFDERKKSALQDGPLCFTRDFKTSFYARTNNKDGVRKASKKGVSKMKIYETHSEVPDPDWSKPVELPFNSDEYNCVHPSLSPDGTKLFFASDMPGGFGGYDLYVVDRHVDGTWGTAVNLGSVINTEKNDLYPFISFQNTLFFASNGRSDSFGGLDLYYVSNPLNKPEGVVNMNEPFNTDKDDKSLIIDPDGKTGFFSSERAKGYGKEDIYSFNAPKGLEGFGKSESNVARFTVKDAKTGEPLQNASIRILQPSDDGFISGKNDFYTIDLLPIQDKKNALSLQIVRKGADDLGTPDLYSNVAGEARTDFDRYRSYLVLVSLDGYRTMERLISVESEDDVNLNFKLSEAPLCMRAGGIVLSNEFGTRISSAVVKMVHKITGEEVTVRTTLNGEFDACLPVEGEYIGYVEHEGFKPANFKIVTGRGKRPTEEVRLKPLVEGASVEEAMPLANGLQDGSVIVMDKIFYEYNKATLNQSAVRHLEALLELLKRYPEMEIDLVVHTDTRGEAGLNQELTDKRAENAKAYLTFRGIDPNRVNAIGKGETQPRNRCTEGVECSDDEHQENNRLEIKVRKLGSVIRP